MFKNLKPSKENLKVYNPATKLFLPKDGLNVSMTSYWMRRLSCDDVVECKEKQPPVRTNKKTNKKTNKAEV